MTGRTATSEAADRPPRKRVVIVGGGFAGLAAARALRRADADVLLLDRRNHHIFQPLLYQVATSLLSPAQIATPLRQLEVRQQNLSVGLADVTGVNLAERTVEARLAGGRVRNIPFDFLVVATGSRASYLGRDEFARHAPGLKTLADAEAIRARILSAFEIAATTDDEAERKRQMTFVMVGGGPAGVELAASLAHMVRVTLRGNFRRIDPAKSSVFLLHSGERILPTFDERLSRAAAQRLAKQGVKVLTGIRVEGVDARGVVAGDTSIPSATVLWTAGVAASPLARMLGGETDRAGRARVDPFLRAVDDPDVFVVGDTASAMQNGRPTPGLAQAAIQQGRYVGRLIAGELQGRKAPRPFRYVDRGSMAVVGSNFAVLQRGRLRTRGLLTWLAWALVHSLSLPQLHSRLSVQREWIWAYVTGQRSSRLIPELPASQDQPLPNI